MIFYKLWCDTLSIISHCIRFVDDGTGCGINKGCFRNPVGCLPKSNGCKFVSWIYVSVG